MKTNSKTFNLLLASLPVLTGIMQVSPAHATDSGYLPYGWFNMDIASKLINEGVSTQLSPADPKAGYRLIKTRSIDIIGGIYGGWYLNEGTLASTLFGAGAAILPVGGTTVISDRFVQSEKQAEHLPALKIPAHAEGLNDWLPHDNVFYDLKGGVVFSVGVGYAMNGLSGDYLVQGDWTTYVEKLDGSKVFVKISNVAMNDFDQMAGTQPVYAMLSEFVKNDQFFSYIFDVADSRGARAYEAMIHGSMKEAQDLELNHPELATQDLMEQGHTKGHDTKLFLGLPFLNRTKTFGQLYNFSDTLVHPDQSESVAQYGLYWNQTNSAVISHHKGFSESFYGVSSAEGQYGNLNISIEDDHSNSKTFQEALAELESRTGIQVRSVSPVTGDLAYTHFNFSVHISEMATRHLVEMAGGSRFAAVPEMQQALRSMSNADAKHDDVGFVKAYAKFGKAMLSSAQAFNLVLSSCEGSSVDLSLQVEGTKISKVNQKISPQEGNNVVLF